jgi:hypothetical protein
MIEDAEMYGMAIYQPAAIALTRQLGLDITGSQRECDDPGDSELIGAILADIGEPLAAGTIASALGWTVDRVLDAAGGAAHRAAAGRADGDGHRQPRLALASHADGISDEIRADLHAARARIDDTAAALLHGIITRSPPTSPLANAPFARCSPTVAIPSPRIEGQRRIDASDVDAYLARHRDERA